MPLKSGNTDSILEKERKNEKNVALVVVTYAKAWKNELTRIVQQSCANIPNLQ